MTSVNTTSDNHNRPLNKKQKRMHKDENKVIAHLSIQLPEGWTQEDAQLGNQYIEILKQTDIGFDTLEKEFYSIIPSTHAKLICIRRNKNMGLYLNYCGKVSEMKQQALKNGETDLNIQRLWHGTKILNAEEIAKKNLDKGLAQSSNGTLYGKGVYLSSMPLYAAHDVYSKPSEEKYKLEDGEGNKIILPIGTKCLIQCDAIIGKALPIANNNRDLVSPPDGFDCTCNEEILDNLTKRVRLPAKSVYCIFDTNKIYPCHFFYFLPTQDYANVFKVGGSTQSVLQKFQSTVPNTAMTASIPRSFATLASQFQSIVGSQPATVSNP